jgi:arylsulfatase A-like enzyme
MYVHVPLFVPRRFLRESENGGYGGAVACIDWVAEVIFHELERLGLDENTMVVFTSDNGSRARDEGGSNAPLRGTKFTTWEGGQRVACIVRWPGKVPAGRVCDELVTSMDFMPTLARLVGAAEPQDRTIDGKDIAPLLFGDEGAVTPHERFYYYRLDNLEAVRKGKWKLHFAKGKAFGKEGGALNELYDLDSDIGEAHNVFDDHPDVVEELRAVAEEARRELGDALTEAEGTGRREVGLVEDPKPLVTYDEDHPYIVSAYDTPDTEVMAG